MSLPVYNEELFYWTDYCRRYRYFNEKRADLELEVIAFAVVVAKQSSDALLADAAPPAEDALIRTALQNNRILIQHRDASPGCRSLAEYYKKMIVLYDNRIRGAVAPQTTAILPCSLEQICIAHELFHALEDIQIGDVVRQTRKMLGCGALHSKVLSYASEIAAHTFAKYLLALPIFPPDILL